MFDVARLRDLLEIALLAGSVASLYFSPKVLRWMFKKLRSAAAAIQALVELPSVLPTFGQIQSLEKSVSHVLREVLPNGGSSMRDTINHMARVQQEQSQGLQSLERTLILQTGVMRAHYDADGVYARFETDGLGRYTWVNRTYLRWVGRSLEQVLGYGWVNSLGLEAREHVREEWERAISERREFSMRYKLRDICGHEFAVDCVAVPVAGEDPHLPERWVGHLMRVEG